MFHALGNGELDFDTEFNISQDVWRRGGANSGGSTMFAKLDSDIRLEDRMRGVIVQSGNDASVALAEHISGDEEAFAQLMNRYALELGMTGSHFRNASGLPAKNHYSTARDMATIAVALIRDFPEHYSLHSVKEYTYNGIVQENRNPLLWRDSSVDGLKTGHTNEAGYCLVASASRDGMRLISVVMGADSKESRARSSERLLNYGFRFYETREVYRINDPVTDVRVWQGAARRLSLGVDQGLYLTIERGQFKRIETQMAVEPQILAPVNRGDTKGQLTLQLDGERLAQLSLVALKSVPEGSLWERMSDYVRMMFH